MLAQKIALTGAAPTFAAPAASDTVPIGSLLVVKNGSASSINVTIATAGTLPTGDDYPDKVYAVAAGAERWIPVEHEAYRKTDGSGNADVTFSATASVTVAAIAPF